MMVENGRSKKSEYKRFTISLPADLNAEFEELRAHLKISRSDAIRKAMRSFLKDESQIFAEKFTGSILGTITYLEKAHRHGGASHSTAPTLPSPQSAHSHPHPHTSDVQEHAHSPSDTYYFPVDQLEFIKINDLQHLFMDVIISATHIHAGPEKCMLIIAVNGSFARVKELFRQLSSFKTIENIELTIIERGS